MNTNPIASLFAALNMELPEIRFVQVVMVDAINFSEVFDAVVSASRAKDDGLSDSFNLIDNPDHDDITFDLGGKIVYVGLNFVPAFIEGFTASAQDDLRERLQVWLDAKLGPTYGVALPPAKRWSADISVVCTHGHRFSQTVEIDEVDELHDLIERGPTYGPGYTADIRLTYL